MLTPAQLLEPLARHRTDEVVVATMSVTRPWGLLSDSDLDFAAMGRAAGFPRASRYDDPGAWAEGVEGFLTTPGPSLAHVRVEPGTQGPIGRGPDEGARYLRTSLTEWSRTLRAALTP